MPCPGLHCERCATCPPACLPHAASLAPVAAFLHFSCPMLFIHVVAVGGSEFSQLLTADVMNVLANGATRPVVRKKAALCLLRLIRKAPADAEIMQPDVWGVKLATMLEDRDLGVLLGLTTLLLGVVSRSYEGE